MWSLPIFNKFYWCVIADLHSYMFDARTPTIMGATTLSIMGLFATLSVNDTQHNNMSAVRLSVVTLSVAFHLFLC